MATMNPRHTFSNLLGSAGDPARRARRLAGHIFQNLCIWTTDGTDDTDWQLPSSVQSVVQS